MAIHGTARGACNWDAEWWTGLISGDLNRYFFYTLSNSLAAPPLNSAPYDLAIQYIMPQYLEPYLPVFALLIAGMVIVGALKLFLPSGRVRSFPYQRIDTLFTPAECSFLHVLDQVVDSSGYRVFGKVRIADVLKVKSGINRSDWQKAFNRISAKHFDFVICRSSDLAIVAAIELDDSSHRKRNRKERDRFVDKAAGAAGFPLVRVPCRRSYSQGEIRDLLAPYLR